MQGIALVSRLDIGMISIAVGLRGAPRHASPLVITETLMFFRTTYRTTVHQTPHTYPQQSRQAPPSKILAASKWTRSACLTRCGSQRASWEWI